MKSLDDLGGIDGVVKEMIAHGRVKKFWLSQGYVMWIDGARLQCTIHVRYWLTGNIYAGVPLTDLSAALVQIVMELSMHQRPPVALITPSEVTP